MDVKTLATAVALTDAALAVVLVVAYRMGPKFAGPGWWALGQTSVALGIILRNFASDTGVRAVVIPMWIALVIGGFMSVYVGLLRFVGRHERRWTLWAWLGIVIAGVAWYTFGANLINVRAALLYASVAAVAGLSSWAAWRYSPRALRSAAVLTALAFGCTGVVYVVLATASAARWASTTALFAAEATTVGAYFALLATSILWTFSLVNLVSQRLQRDAAQQADNLRTVFITSPDCAAITRLRDGELVDVNEGFTEILLYSRSEAIGSTTLALGIWVDPADRLRMVSDLEVTGICSGLRAAMRRKDGVVIQTELTSRLLEFDGEPFLVSVIRDITERLRLEQVLQREATTDHLTGLPNRRQFFAAAEDELNRAESTGTSLSICIIDIDDFKAINDTLGHAAGDAAATEFAALLASLVADRGTIARLGGDEFGLLLPGLSVGAAVELVDDIRNSVQREKFDLGVGRRSVTFSAGVAKAVDSIDGSLARADDALYSAKSAGRNTVVSAQ